MDARAELVAQRRAVLLAPTRLGDLARGVMAFVGDGLLDEAAALLTAAYDAGLHGLEGLRMELLVHHERAGRSLDRVPLGHPSDRATLADVRAAVVGEDVAVELVDHLEHRRLEVIAAPALAGSFLTGFCRVDPDRVIRVHVADVRGVVAVRRRETAISPSRRPW